ncbi:MAG: GNAT family N-acetyltransferase [Promethearchaeota archaeon]
MRVEIRKATQEDLPEIMKIEYQIFKKEAFPEYFMRRLLKNHLIFFILFENKDKMRELIGYITVLQVGHNSANIINLAIKPNAQNKKYGSLLLDYTIKKIKMMKNIKKILLNVKTKNAIAVHLYRKMNFKIVKILKNYYSNKEPAYLMELNLQE